MPDAMCVGSGRDVQRSWRCYGGSIPAQNSFLGGQSLRYSIAPGGDGDAFEIDGTALKLKSTPNYASKSSYTVTISSTGGFGASNSETFEIRVV